MWVKVLRWEVEGREWEEGRGVEREKGEGFRWLLENLRVLKFIVFGDDGCGLGVFEGYRFLVVM